MYNPDNSPHTKTWWTIGILTILILGLLAVQYLVKQNQELRQQANVTTQTLCTANGGTWQSYSTSCGDQCQVVTNPSPICTRMPTESCNCGPTKCWDDTTGNCIDNPTPPGCQWQTPDCSRAIACEPQLVCPEASTSPTPSPSATPDISPTPSPSGFHLTDIDRDGDTDLFDFSHLKNELANRAGVYDVDLNQDGNLNLLDFSFWKNEYSQL